MASMANDFVLHTHFVLHTPLCLAYSGPDAIKKQTWGAFGINNATGPGHVSIDCYNTSSSGWCHTLN